MRPPRLLQCARMPSPAGAACGAALVETGLDNAFNPSHAVAGGRELLAFRAFSPRREKPFNAYLASRPAAGGAWELHDLTAHFARHGVGPVADPKLVVLGGEAHVTSNTGWQPERNEVHLTRVTPELGPPRRCVLEGRQPVEKNWAFYEQDGELRAVYGLAPLRLLRAVPGAGDGPDLPLEPLGSAVTGGRITRLTLGSQPVVRDGELHLVAHEKRELRRRRLYVGRLVRLRPADGAVDVSPTRLVHDLRALRPLPAARRHNPNVLTVTYFSGLRLDGDAYELAYGVNDLRCGFARVPVAALWR